MTEATRSLGEASSTGAPLRHGIFVPPLHPVRENPTLCLERDMQLMELVDDLGYDEAWIGEHHSGGWEVIDSPELFIAAAAVRTKRLRFGTGVVSVPYHNPLNTANRLLQLDHMTRGRVMLGVGPGLLVSDALMIGLDPNVQRDRLAEGLSVIMRLLRGESVTEKTDWYDLVDARTHLSPYTHPFPEVAVASSVTPSGARVAGKHGLGMLCVAASYGAGYSALGTNWQTACETAAAYGNQMDRGRLRLVVPMHLAATRQQAYDNVRAGLVEFAEYYGNHQTWFKIPEGKDPVEWVVENGFATVGTPDDAIEAVERLLAQQGEFGALLFQSNNWAPWEQTKQSYELYARYVMPHFSNANNLRAASYDWVAERHEELTATRNAATDRAMAGPPTATQAGGAQAGSGLIEVRR